MDKASRAIRRSGAKLLSLGSGGNSDLNVMISELKDIRTNMKAFMAAQESASQDMKRWAANEENRAIQDVAYHVAELSMLWTDVQRQFTDSLKEYRQMFELVLEGEKQVTQAKVDHNNCEQKEEKLKKDLKKAVKVKGSRVSALLCGTSRREATEEVYAIEGKLEQVQVERDAASKDVTEMIRENEAVKLIRLKEGFVRMAEAYIELGKKCATIFQAQKDVALEIPDVHGQELEEVKYAGTPNTQNHVQKAKEKLNTYRRESYRLEKPIMKTVTIKLENDVEPPPPYSSTEEYHNTSTDSCPDNQDGHHVYMPPDTYHDAGKPSPHKSPVHVTPTHHPKSSHYNSKSARHPAPSPGTGTSPGNHKVQTACHKPPHGSTPIHGNHNLPHGKHTTSHGSTPTHGNHDLPHSKHTASHGAHHSTKKTGPKSDCHSPYPGYTPETPTYSPHKSGSTPSTPGYKSIYPTLPADEVEMCKKMHSTKIH